MRCINSCPHRAIQTSIARLLALLVLQLASLVTFAALFFLPYGDYFPDISLGPLPIGSWWTGFAVALVAWAVLVLLAHLALDELIWICERMPALRPVFRANFTHRYRRYLDPGFDPTEP